MELTEAGGRLTERGPDSINAVKSHFFSAAASALFSKFNGLFPLSAALSDDLSGAARRSPSRSFSRSLARSPAHPLTFKLFPMKNGIEEEMPSRRNNGDDIVHDVAQRDNVETSVTARVARTSAGNM